MKQTLTLMKNDDNDAIFRANAAAESKITLDEISWYMHVMHVDREKMELYKINEKKEKLPVGYRMIQCDSISVNQETTFAWRLGVKSSPEVPRFIIVGFQTNKSGDQRHNPSTFNNEGVKNIYATQILRDIQQLTIIFRSLDSNLVESMVMPRYLGLRFLTWTSYYQTQTFPPQIIEPSILCFCLMFPSKVKG